MRRTTRTSRGTASTIRCDATQGNSTVEHAVARALLDVAAELPAHAERLGRFLTRGKRLRARLVLLAAHVRGHAPTSRAIRLATAIELIHAGALCHDDVVDRSYLRRGEPSLLAALGPGPAVQAGLWLLLRGAMLLAHEPVAVRTAVARAVHEIVRGQIDELEDLFLGALSPDDYLRRARAKTGALYGLAGRLGAFAGALSTTETDAVACFATEMGLGFQLADDLRDFWGGESLGREAGTDLREGVYTLPVLLTLSGRCRGADELRQHLARPWSPEVLPACLALLQRNGALDATMRRARSAIDHGVRALGACPPTTDTRQLAALADEVLAVPSFVVPRAMDRTDPGLPAPLTAGSAHALSRRYRAWSARARTAPDHFEGLSDAILAAATAVDGSPADAVHVGFLDLLVADLFALLSRDTAAKAVWRSTVLALRIRQRLVAA